MSKHEDLEPLQQQQNSSPASSSSPNPTPQISLEADGFSANVNNNINNNINNNAANTIYDEPIHHTDNNNNNNNVDVVGAAVVGTVIHEGHPQMTQMFPANSFPAQFPIDNRAVATPHGHNMVHFPVVPAMQQQVSSHPAGTNTLPLQGSVVHNPQSHNNIIYLPSSAIPQQLEQDPSAIINGPRQGTFNVPLFTCLDDVDGMLESWCLGRCQLARQWNMVNNGYRGMDVGMLFASIFLDFLISPAGIWFLTYATRRRIRERYNFVDDQLGDCVLALACNPCVVHQQYKVMSIRGDWPAGCCISTPYALAPNPSNNAMV